MYLFPGAAITKYHKPSGLDNRNVLFHGSRGKKSAIKMLAGLAPSEGCEGMVCSRPLTLSCCTFLCGHISFL